MDFAANYDTTFSELCLKAYVAGVLPLDATLTVLATGKLPEEFKPEDVALRMMADAANRAAATPPEMQGDPSVTGDAIAPSDTGDDAQDAAPNSKKQTKQTKKDATATAQ
jgi:hypothetical protein